ncbi:DUF2510 domain-containing protein [Microlunatus sp. Gsoil 973]|uniref:DUF2510 domain-containing protein n=1 Tax=Microlunatus sp. Gsoil 973 TaxID=2672569 RepID=UPI0012B48D65|nr:DUF2510 domain-containing protein [Microlunatus sp. Gsoil 973]QGN33418.1 DUF2510 domain-containing protein [Microlunatus sp. Gsoil 973]
MTGWYPDPGGQPNRYRYWDGASWSEETSIDPADPPPGSPGRLRQQSGDENRHYGGAAFGLAALALVVVVVSTVMIIRRAGDPQALDAPPGPGASVSAWDDRSPLAGPPGPGPAQATTIPQRRQTCPGGDPDERAPHPVDGRVHGGRLSMPRAAGYSTPVPEYMLSWMSDTQGISQTTEPGWQSIFAVGELQRTAEFSTVRKAAHSSMECAIHSAWYLNLVGHKPIRDEPITIDGHDAWILTWNVYDDTPGLQVAGDQLTFLAVDDGRSDAYSMWCGMVPLGDTDRTALDGRMLADLEVGG